jgi:electron transfer flavoprotein beta subunit
MLLACLKWVSLRPEVDALSGEVVSDSRWSGLSAADEAALEVALRAAETSGTTVTAITVGPHEAQPVLKLALECGAARAVHIRTNSETTSIQVATLIAQWSIDQRDQRDGEPDLIVCGDASMDRGSGAVPVFIAERLGLGDACGLVRVQIVSHGSLSAERRLDGGRREQMVITTPAVISVEGVAAHLRRATIAQVLVASKRAAAGEIEVVTPSHVDHETTEPVSRRAYRPRARVLECPSQQLSALRRVELLTGAFTDRQPPRRMTLSPVDAAETIIDQLTTWGYLDAKKPASAERGEEP